MFESRTLLVGYSHIRITAERHEKCPNRSKYKVTIFSKEVSYSLAVEIKSMYSSLGKLILYSFLIFLEQITRVS